MCAVLSDVFYFIVVEIRQDKGLVSSKEAGRNRTGRTRKANEIVNNERKATRVIRYGRSCTYRLAAMNPIKLLGFGCCVHMLFRLLDPIFRFEFHSRILRS